MVTKAIVVEVINRYKVKVRIPIFNKIEGSPSATAYDDLPLATISCPPEISPYYTVGDVVYVAIEDNDVNKPVIIGQLFREAEDLTSQSEPDFSFLDVKIKSTLPEDTTIGNVSSKSIQTLQGCTTNIENRLDLLNQQIEFLQEQINELKSKSK